MIKEQFEKKIRQLQSQIVNALIHIDPEVDVLKDEWDRPGGGGGYSNILTDGKYIEKAGVNISIVHGILPEEMKKRLKAKSASFYASGISLVIHPCNPFAPTVHFNIRYFELYEGKEKVDSWFGGGMDMTPYYVFEDDCRHFHATLKTCCDRFDRTYYKTYKSKCDDYFYNSHRKEHRGIGGIFFDYLKEDKDKSTKDNFNFTEGVGQSFLEAYLPILEKRKDIAYTAFNKEWQEIRRGRYVEFNLIHDRGTLFGLRTNGRTESILMSLPPAVRWKYNHHPEEGSKEAELIKALKPRDWAENI